jgi:transketolase
MSVNDERLRGLPRRSAPDREMRCSDLARRIRAQALRMVHRARASHIGGCLSAADLLAHLYGGWLKVDPARPDWPDRDRFLLSKGHTAAAIYAALAERGFFPREWLETYCADGARLGGHITSHGVPGVEVSTGSLGHGLPLALGMALGFKRARRANRVVVLMSDGECDEGTTWETALMAPHWGCDNLLAIVDYNKIQSLGSVEEVAPLEPFAEKWRAFRWGVREIDGHSHGEIAAALAAFPFEKGHPSILIAHTVKGKGVSFMEGKLLWHYRSPSDEQLAQALAEIGETEGSA